MLGNRLGKSRLRYALYRWVLPRLGHEPLAIKNLSQKAWPTVAAFTSARQYTDQIECIEWESKGGDDGSDLLAEYTRTSRALVLKGYAASSMGTSWNQNSVTRRRAGGSGVVPRPQTDAMWACFRTRLRCQSGAESRGRETRPRTFATPQSTAVGPGAS